MAKRNATVWLFLSVASAILLPNCFSQVLTGSRQEERHQTAPFRWSLSNELLQRLGKNMSAGRTISIPVSQGPSPAAIAAARKRSAGSSQSNLGSSGKLLSVAPATLMKSTPQASGGSKHVESLSVGSKSGTGVAQLSHTLPCANAGIHDVNGVTGTTTDTIFMEPGKNYVIHGCGFGDQPGEAYLTGISHQEALSAGGTRRQVRLHSDWIRLIPASGADPHQKQAWTDTEIQVLLDPNTSGFLDDYGSGIILVIPTGGKPQLQTPNAFAFWAAREEQQLPSIPLPGSAANSKQASGVTVATNGNEPLFAPGLIKDGAAHVVPASLLSPSAASLVLPGHTLAVVRDDSSSGFPSGQDKFVLEPLLLSLKQGFQVSHVQLFTANLTPDLCSKGSNFLSSGNWNPAFSDPYHLTVSWQEQSCGGNGVSVYALDLKVTGPRGVSPM